MISVAVVRRWIVERLGRSRSKPVGPAVSPEAGRADVDPEVSSPTPESEPYRSEIETPDVVDEYLAATDGAGDEGRREVYASLLKKYESDAESRARLAQFRAVESLMAGGSSDPSPVPAYLGAFRIGRMLDRGGQGGVYVADDRRARRRVAVKALDQPGGGTSGSSGAPPRPFAVESLVQANLHHSHIPPVFEVGEPSEGPAYFAMRLIGEPNLEDLARAFPASGGSASARLDLGPLFEKAERLAVRRRTTRRLASSAAGSGRPSAPTTFLTAAGTEPAPPSSLSGLNRAAPPATESRKVSRTLSADAFRLLAVIGVQTADALEYAHNLGILHLDVKPANILVQRYPVSEAARTRIPTAEHLVHAWLIDFGYARAAPDAAVDSLAVRLGLRDIAGFGGTKGYVAPELHSADPSRQSDIFGLGAALYFAMTLSPPFEDAGKIEGSPTLGGPARRVPSEFEAIVLRCLRRNPEDRYGSAAELAADLRRFLAGEPTVAGRAGPVRRTAMWARRKPGWAAAAGLLSLLIVAVVLLFRSDAIRARGEADAAHKDAEAKSRELAWRDIARLQAPIRARGWRDLALKAAADVGRGRADDDGRGQIAASALLAGFDARPGAEVSKMTADSIAFSADGSKLLVSGPEADGAGRSTRLEIHDLDSSGGAKVLPSVAGTGVVGFRANGHAVFLGFDPFDPTSARLRGLEAGDGSIEFPSPADGWSAVSAVALSRDGGTAAAVFREARSVAPAGRPRAEPKSKEQALAVWNTESGQFLAVFREPEAFGRKLALSPDGRMLATWDASGRDPAVMVWSVALRRRAGRFSLDRGVVGTAAFGRDPASRPASGCGWRLAVGEAGGAVRVWSLDTGGVVSIGQGSNYDVTLIDFSADGSLMVSAGRYEARLWNPANGDCLLAIPAGNIHRQVRLSPGADRLAVAEGEGFSFANRVEVFEIENGRGADTLLGLAGRVEKVRVSLDGKRLAGLGVSRGIVVYDIGKRPRLLGVFDAPLLDFPDNAAVALDKSGSRLFCSGGSAARLWTTEDSALVREWSLPPALTEAAGFVDDKLVVLARQETERGDLPPDSRADRIAHPRVCRIYEFPLVPESDPTRRPKPAFEFGDLNHYVEHIVLSPDAAYCAATGTTRDESGGMARRILVFKRTEGGWTRLGAIATSTPPSDSHSEMRMDPSGRFLHVTTGPGIRSLYELPATALTPVPWGLHALAAGGGRRINIVSTGADHFASLEIGGLHAPAPDLRIGLPVHMAGVDSLMFLPVGDRIAWGGMDGAVVVADQDLIRGELKKSGF